VRYDAGDITPEVSLPVLPLTRIDHVSFATPSIDDSLRWFQAVFGAREVRRHAVAAEGYTFAELEVPNAQVGFELIEPLGEDSFVARFLRERGPGFHHITVEVENVDTAAEEMRTQGIEPFGGVRGDGHWRQTFIHPRDSGGILVQLVQAGK
jgi:methylmalonyl-CoA/ethylmalonyl-CoA epimerase